MCGGETNFKRFSRMSSFFVVLFLFYFSLFELQSIYELKRLRLLLNKTPKYRYCMNTNQELYLKVVDCVYTFHEEILAKNNNVLSCKSTLYIFRWPVEW